MPLNISRRRLWLSLIAPLTGAAAEPVWGADSIQNWKTSKEFTLAVADAMPEAKFDFRPNDEEMKFAELIAHIAGSQAFRFGQIADEKPVLGLQQPSSKAEILIFLVKSFDYCISKLGVFTAAQMDRQFKVDWYGRPSVSGRQLVLGMFTHTAHHRGQAEVYLRACGVKPPAYRF